MPLKRVRMGNVSSLGRFQGVGVGLSLGRSAVVLMPIRLNDIFFMPVKG